ncbi:hypothetical protein N2152v2_003093 [Parachlorella kessleri]
MFGDSLPANLLTLALLSPAWYLAGRLAGKLRLLPLITGYLIAGVVSGPAGLGAVSAEGLAALRPVDHTCLSLIALAAGAELQLAELRKIRRQVTWITLGIAVCTWVLVFACTLGLVPYVPFTAKLPQGTGTAVATLVATLAVARSPASAIAILKETEGKGPYCSLVMAVVVFKDVLVFVCFALNIQLAKAATRSEQALGLVHLVDPVVSIAISVGLGLAGGYVLGAMRQPYFAASRYNPAVRLLPASWRTRHVDGILARSFPTSRLRPAAPLAVSSCVFFLSEAVHGEPLLACVTAGLVVANTRLKVPQATAAASDASSGAAAGDAMQLLVADMARLMPVMNVLFFGLVGASLKLAAVRDTLWVALLLYLVRLAGIWVGCYSGAALGGAPEVVGSRVWMGMVTQAGVALGLARIVSGAFPGWGQDFAALEAGVVLMNLFTGPPLFKAAVIAVGEARALGLPALAPEFDSGLKRDASMPNLSGSIPQIPIISVLQPSAVDGVAGATSLLKQHRSAFDID